MCSLSNNFGASNLYELLVEFQGFFTVVKRDF